jgi:hypothetical protein
MIVGGNGSHLSEVCMRQLFLALFGLLLAGPAATPGGPPITQQVTMEQFC